MSKVQELNKADVQDILALTPMQEGMLFHYINNNSEQYSEQYTEQLCLTLIGETNIQEIKKAWTFVAENNEALRTCFRWDKLSKPVQVILKRADLVFFEYDLTKDLHREKLAEEIKTKDYYKQIDLSTETLRITIIMIDDSTFEMVLTYHHILFDGWSTGILLKEFLEAINLLNKNSNPFSIKKNRFKEFIKLCQGQDKTQYKKYWVEYFKGFEGNSPLPLNSGNQNTSNKNEKIVYKLSEELSQNIYGFCKEEKTTIAALFYTAWGLLLNKYSNANDIVFGTTVSGRNVPLQGIEDMTGLFINTLPLRVNINESDNILNILKKVDYTLKTRNDYQHTPLVDIKACSNIGSRDELFDTIVVIENYPLDSILFSADDSIKIEKYSINEITNYKLTLAIIDFKGLKLQLSFNNNEFSSEIAGLMLKHYENIIEIMINEPAIKYAELELITKAEKEQMLKALNSTNAAYPKNKTIHELFEEQVEKTPDNVAVVLGTKALTYEELNRRSNQLARLLRKKGAGSENIVAIMAERSIEMIVGIIGILKAGSAYLPIDPEYPRERIEYMLKDSGANILLSHNSLGENISYWGEIIKLDEESVYTESINNLQIVNTPNHLAYVIYTSGTTGNPKGAMIEHRNVVRLMFNDKLLFDFTEKDVWTMFHSYCFDFSVWEMYGALLYGGKLIIIPKIMAQDTAEFLEVLDKEKVTILNQTPSAFYRLSEEIMKTNKNNLCLRYIIFGGEALKPIMLKEYNEIYPMVKLVNMYGITETTVHVTYKEITKDDIKLNASNIGKPIPTLTTYVVDRNVKLLPIGVPGELCVGGEGVGRGYINRPELTDEKFIDNPFEQNGKLYKSGDLVRMLPNGDMEYLGRIDHQVKIRGFRIELGEIEHKLITHPSVKEAVVIAREDKDGGKYLCAYVSCTGEIAVATELREHLSKDLPGYMVPSYFIQIDKLPLTSNGKVDKKSLPEPDGIIKTGAAYEAPKNEVEEKLVRIWREVLNIDKIGINDNFFEIGGHSLKATSLAAKIHKELDVKIPLGEIFKNPTIKEIAEYLKIVDKSIYSELNAVEEREYYEASSAQKRIYTLQQFDTDSTSYNMPGVLELEGKVDAERLREVFDKLIQRHEVLRTSFELKEEEIIQKVHKEVEFDICYIETAEEGSTEGIVNNFIKPFDLGKAPLFRAALISLSENSGMQSEKHLILFDMHHIISDGVSMGILIKELTKLYERKELTPLRIQYKDFAAWQNELLKGDRVKEQEEYWLRQFREEIPVLNMSTDYPRSSAQSFEGDSISFLLGKELTGELNKIVKETGSTLYMVLLTVFNILLSKYSGQEDIIVGSPIAGRHHADLENIMGMFVNTLAIRSYPEGKKTFKEFLTEVKDKALKAYENQDYQFEELVSKLNLTRDMSRNPLFDVMFAMQNMDKNQLQLGETIIKEYKTYNRISKFDMTLFAVEIESDIELSIEYCTKLFNKGTIERVYKHLKNIIEKIVKNQNIHLKEIEIITEEEKQQILANFNDTKAAYPGNKTIQQLFEEQAKRTPDNIALVFEDKQLTYRELDEKSNQLARELRIREVGSESIVGIMVERSLEMVIGMLGILKSGGAYLPIDLEYPQERIEFMLKDSNVRILLAQSWVNTSYIKGKEILNLDSIIMSDKDKSSLQLVNNSSSLAYAIYTSGSTGMPKGVLIEHKAIVNTLNWRVNQYKFNSDDIVLQIPSFSFDSSVEDIFTPLLSGAQLHIIRAEDRLNIRYIGNYISSKKITHFLAVPSFFKTLLDEVYKQLKSLKSVTIAGESFSHSLVQEHYSKLPDTKLYNEYGPTENSVCSTVYEFSKDCSNVTIGRPIHNCECYIINKYGNLQPIGVPGELCVSGVGLARGYMNRSELTTEKFVDNPFRENTKMYRTGDLARWLPNGNIVFLGRADYQVKIRGFRIELGEIENKLLSHKEIKEAVVIAREDNKGQKYLCGYIAANGELEAGELKAHLSKELPDYMIPAFFIYLEKLPLTANGKIDRKVLMELDIKVSTETEYEAPRNEIEETLLEIWKKILGIERIGINDNFFELGGHSLKATSLSAKIHKQLNAEVPLKEIFKTPTIKQIAEYINKADTSIYTEIKPVEEKEYYHMSSAQKRVFTLQQFDLSSTTYNMPGVLEIDGELDNSRVENAFMALIEKHESLRTSFGMKDEIPVQIIHKEVNFQIEYMEKAIYKGVQLEKIMTDFIKPFDLGKAPLIRVRLINAPKDSTISKHILMYDMHHIISDGVSMNILIEEFINAYKMKKLPKLKLQYKDYAKWQSELHGSERIAKQEEYWLEAFSGEIPVLNLPTDYQRPSIQSYEGDRVSFSLEEELTKSLNHIAKETGSTLYMVLLSVFNILLSKYSGQEDIIIGSPIAGRPHADLENIIGMFVNTLPMRNYPDREKTLREFIKEVKENALKAFENQDYQFEELVEKLNVPRDMSRNPLFDVMFELQNINIKRMELEEVGFKAYESGSRTAKFDLTITASESDGILNIDIEYCTRLFEKARIERMKVHLIKIIEQVSENIDKQIKDVEIISEYEKKQILDEFNNTMAVYPQNKVIQELFQEQVEKAPNNIAVAYEESQLTYKELNEKANQLARVLRDKGVGPGRIVGIMVERSLDMIVGIMGILKAGGAYLPIDPDYPEDRIEYMLTNSAAELLLTQNSLQNRASSEFNIVNIEEPQNYANNKTNLEIINEPDDLVYILYTSGTTGNPKGVMIEHRNLVNIAFAWKDHYKLDKMEVKLLQMASMSFDVFAGDLCRALLWGGTMYICPNDIKLDMRALYQTLRERSISIFESTPSLIIPFMDYIYENNLELESLKILILGSDACPMVDYKKLVERYGEKMRILNSYGITEVTIDSSYYEEKSEQALSMINTPIGKPLNNTQFYILDKALKLQPIGVCGELYIGGDGVARGYYNQPDLTSSKFIENPYKSGERMYRTGDVAKWLQDGNVEFLGRADHQVKIRGFRIEIAEIERQLLSCEEIREAIVIDRNNSSGVKYLCAYIVLNSQITIKQLRKHLSLSLPEYMVPSYFIQLEKLPLTPNGKVDRKALPEPDGNINTGAEYEAPRNEAEEKLVEIWKEVLAVEKMGINDNFFELGGHSLKATSLLAKIHKQLNVEVPLREIFNTPTIKGISEYIKGTKENIYAAIDKTEAKEHYEMSSAQKRIYTLQQFDPESTSYNMPVAVEIEGTLDKERLKEAFKKLVQRHESLRTSFEVAGEEIVQVIHEQPEIEIEYKQLKISKGKGVVDTIEEEIKSFVTAFNLSKPPLLRVKLIEIDVQKHVLLLDMHHIISDGVSMNILVKDFTEAYEGKAFRELRLQYKDYAEWQNVQRKTDRMKKQEEYWLKVFKRMVPILNLPTDYPRPAVKSFEGDRMGFELTEEVTEKLKDIARETGSTIYMLLLTAFNILLSKYSGQDDIVIGSPIAGRPHADLENIIGMFVNTLAMRNYPRGEKTIREFIGEVKDNALKAYEHQDYQLEELVDKLKMPRDMSRNPLFDVMLVMQNMTNEELNIEGLKFKSYEAENKTTKFDIGITAMETERTIVVDIEYCTRLFKNSTISTFKKHLLDVVQAIVNNDCMRIKDIELDFGVTEMQYSDFSETDFNI